MLKILATIIESISEKETRAKIDRLVKETEVTRIKVINHVKKFRIEASELLEGGMALRFEWKKVKVDELVFQNEEIGSSN